MYKLVKNFFSLTTANLFSRLAGLLYLPYIARVFGPDGMGKVNFAESITGFFLMAANFGFDVIGTREVAKYKDKQDAFIHIILIEIATSCVSFLALCAFVYLIDQPFEVKMLILLYGFSILTFAFTIDWFFMGMELMGTVAIVSLIRQLSYIGLILLVIHTPQHIYRLPISFAMADVVQIAILFYLFQSRIKFHDYRIKLNSIRFLFNEAVSVGISGFMNSSRERIGPILLGFMRSIEEVGFYSVSFKLLCVANIVPYMFYRAIFPDMSYFLKDKSSGDVALYIKGIIRIVSVIAIPFSFIIYFNAPVLVRIIFGEGFKEGIVILQIMIWSTAVLLFNRVYYYYMVATGKQKKLFFCTLAGLLMNIGLCFIFIIFRGDSGAALAFLVSELVLSVLYYFASGVKILPGKEFLKSFICFLPSLAVCLSFEGKIHSLLLSLIALTIYVVIIFVTHDVRSLLKIHISEAKTCDEPSFL